jgi:hypothetical protein
MKYIMGVFDVTIKLPERDVDKLGLVNENVSWRERNDECRTFDFLWSGGTLAARALRYERVI